MMSTSLSPLISRQTRFHFWLLFALLLLRPGVSAPQIRIDEPQVLFGEKKTGEMVQHSFQLQNSGDRVLNIRNIRASCGCTTPGTRSLQIQPGETKELPVVIDLKGRSGKQHQVVTFTTNDPENPTVSVTLSGEATPPISINPRTLNLGQINPDNIQAGEITLVSTTQESFDVTKAVANKNRVSVSVEPSPDKKTTIIRVTPKENPGEGQFTDVIVIETTHPEAKKERVLVMWQNYTGVTVTPSSVNLVLAEQPQLLNRYLMVKGYPGLEKPLTVTDVEWVGQEQLEIELTNTKRFGWRIHLKNFEPTQEMADSFIRIQTTAEEYEVIEVPVNVLQ